ncbi:MAG: GNAT family N-acetyltransferase [Lachnospiraceae bacterium]|nr:GNAT family N-acetyltransferase [Lachnospiraceae bacterium]
MSEVYDHCPVFENGRYLLRFAAREDAKDLALVYGDKNALPFFNSDNCHGDNFYYPNEERMAETIAFWHSSYASKWFVRWTIVDKQIRKAIGSIELFHRTAADEFNDAGVLRLDVGSEYETEECLAAVTGMILPDAFDFFDCEEIITKVPIYAVERIKAVQKIGFEKTDRLLIGTADGYAYKDYWFIRRP